MEWGEKQRGCELEPFQKRKSRCREFSGAQNAIFEDAPFRTELMLG
jgi:hypothetical protein